MNYAPQTDDQLLAIRVNAGIGELAGHRSFSEATDDLVEAIVGGIGAYAAGEWAPLNRIGDEIGARQDGGEVCLPQGFDTAYRSYVEQGWNAVAGDEAFGGQGLPFTLAVNILENLGTANMAFALLPMLTVGAIEAIAHHGSDAQKQLHLPKLISGQWSGTMNLTEPQAGSDLGALRTVAVPIADGPHAGKYRVRGTKIFITWGEHELSENIVHLVLARLPGAPEGSRGISLFLVPKYWPDASGQWGVKNDLRCVGLEHKLGIHASPTCVMSFGDNDACIGEIVGREHEGLKAMFTMMNSARINVGSQGVQIAERALQKARAYACERIQSPRAGSRDRSPVAIVEHPDVRRMLLRMRTLTEAARALLYYTAGQVDRGAVGNATARQRADILVPLLKMWATEVGCEVASLGVQVHGGMGFVEETGAAQFYRDARIAPIYEGTNGIQAADLVLRKLGTDDGQTFAALMSEIIGETQAAAPGVAVLAQRCRSIANWMLADASLDDRLAGSDALCRMAAVAVAGWQLSRQANFIDVDSAGVTADKHNILKYFDYSIAAEALGMGGQAVAGAGLLYSISP
ncbi:acyl-CoA dehydrogenase family protein [Sphingopyxis alaskensis]|uniref:acyl-CoA dehydrogenase family protein n=1 Tax=Sphingopyxis alaskensis TaxID=117207 RepID=UPI00203B323D|nr:acyl-CoA dehydrogenase family protein [Sphingopyxis alaskensis]